MHLNVSLYFMRLCEKITGKPLLMLPLGNTFFSFNLTSEGFSFCDVQAKGKTEINTSYLNIKATHLCLTSEYTVEKTIPLTESSNRSIKPKLEICMPQGGKFRNYLPQMKIHSILNNPF